MNRYLKVVCQSCCWVLGATSTAGFAAERGVTKSIKALEEIVVTSRKREETQFDVPMSLSVFSGDEIAATGIENAVDFVGRVPGISTSGDFLSPGKDFIYLVTRGVGANTGGDPATPVFLDGVYQPRLAFDTGFLNVARVEILKGPQGSVFGRNSEGGAVNIVTQRPGDQLQGRVRFEYDEFESFKAQGTFDIPLSENWFSSISLENESRGGYLKNRVTGANLQGDLQSSPGSEDANDGENQRARVALLYRKNEDFSLYFTADAAKFEGLNGLPGVPRGCDCYDVFTEFQIDAKDTNQGASLHLDWALGWADLTSVTGYRSLSTKLPFDFDGGTTYSGNIHDFRSKQEFFSEELRLASTGDSSSVNWLAGLYYFYEELDSERGYDLPTNIALPGLFITDQDVYTERNGVAIFGNAEFSLSESLQLTVGARYSIEDIDGDFATDYTITSFALNVTDSDRESDTFESFTGTLSLKNYWTQDVMSYVTISQGFKAGGYPVAPLSQLDFTAYEEETSLNYELGIKMDAFDNRIKLEASIFHIELEDQQLSTIIEVNGFPVASTANAGESHVDGADFEATWLVTDGLSLSAAVGYVDTEFDDYIDSQGIQRAGESFRFTPELTGSLGVDYTIPLQSGRDLQFSLNYRYVDDYIQGFGGLDPIMNIDSYDMLDARVSLYSDRWQLQLFVDNVTDEYVETRAWDAFFFSVNQSDTFSTVLPPRRAGIRLGFDF